MARININQLRFEVEKEITKTRAFRQAAIGVAQEKLEQAKEEILAKFDEHPITKELEAGADAADSRFLNGYGNLFSFIGFDRGDDPVKALRDFLESHIKLVAAPLTQEKQYIFRINLPSEGDLTSATPMPWGTASSWALAIERGIPGFNRYLFDLDKQFRNSRSGPAIQVDEKHVLRDTTYEPQPYITALLNEFKTLFE